MEINAREARKKISTLLDLAQKGEEVLILRRGKKVARLVPAENAKRRLPDLSDFRASIGVKGEALSETVIKGRDQERY